MANDFSKSTSNHQALYGCVGALDGYAIKIRRPSLRDAVNPLDFVNRKGFFASNMQAICDARCRFTYIFVDTAASTHDATAFTLSSFSKRWAEQAGRTLWWIAADEAYPATENVITPWPGRNLDPFKDAFNFYFSGGNRNIIERAFGIFVKRFGIFRRAMEMGLKTVPKVVLTCAILHNFLISYSRGDFGELEASPITPPEVENPRCGLLFSRAGEYEGRQNRRDREKCRLRSEMTRKLRVAGRLRPAVVSRLVTRRSSEKRQTKSIIYQKQYRAYSLKVQHSALHLGNLPDSVPFLLTFGHL